MAVAIPWLRGALALGLLACSPQQVDVVSGVSCCDDPTQPGCGGSGGGSSNSGGSGNSSGGAASTTGGTASTGGANSATVSLIHRYTFQGDGIDVTDSVGDANGNVLGTMLDGTGSVTLTDASPEQYVELPSFILNGLKDVTFEAWVTWNGGAAWQRVFDFGEDTTGVRNSRGNGRSYLFFTPADPNGRPKLTLGIPDTPKAREPVQILANSTFPEKEVTHVAVVVDDTQNLISLFINGGFQGSKPFDYSLAFIYNINSWLGRSIYMIDPGFNGSIHEFRMYDGALDANQILANYMNGP